MVDEDGHLVGIVSRADVLSVFSRPDAEIRQDIIENVISTPWSPTRPAS